MKYLSIFKIVIILVSISLSTMTFGQYNLFMPSTSEKGDVYFELDFNKNFTSYEQLDNMDGISLGASFNPTDRVRMFVGHHTRNGKSRGSADQNFESANNSAVEVGLGLSHRINHNLTLDSYLTTRFGNSNHQTYNEVENALENFKQKITNRTKAKFVSTGPQLNLRYQKSGLGFSIGSDIHIQKYYDTNTEHVNQTRILEFRSDLNWFEEGLVEAYHRDYFDSKFKDEDEQMNVLKYLLDEDQKINHDNFEEIAEVDPSYSFNFNIQPKISFGKTFKVHFQPSLHFTSDNFLDVNSKNISAGISYQI